MLLAGVPQPRPLEHSIAVLSTSRTSAVVSITDETSDATLGGGTGGTDTPGMNLGGGFSSESVSVLVAPLSGEEGGSLCTLGLLSVREREGL